MTFGWTGDEPSLAQYSSKPEDVNKDKLPDLVCQFTIKDTGFQPGNIVGVLKETTVTGIPFSGNDSIIVVMK